MQLLVGLKSNSYLISEEKIIIYYSKGVKIHECLCRRVYRNNVTGTPW